MMTFRDPRWVTTAERVWRRMLADVFDDRLPDIREQIIAVIQEFLGAGLIDEKPRVLSRVRHRA
jgi:hypothetical protein